MDDYVLMQGFSYVCHVLQFKYLNKKRKKDSEYNSQHVNCDDKNFKLIGALCSFYKFNFSEENHLILELSESVPIYVPLSCYLHTLPEPSITDNDCLMYDASISNSIYETIKEHLNL